MHVSHMRTFIPEYGLAQPSKGAVKSDGSQRVAPIPSSDEGEARGFRQQRPWQDGAKVTVPKAGADSVKTFSSLLVALDLSSLGDAGSGGQTPAEEATGASDAKEPGIFQLLARAATGAA